MFLLYDYPIIIYYFLGVKMTYYNLVKLAEEKKDKESFIGSRDHLIGTAGGAALGGAIYDRASKPLSYKDQAAHFGNTSLKKLQANAAESLKDIYTRGNHSLDSDDFKRHLASQDKNISDIYHSPAGIGGVYKKDYEKMGIIDKFIGGKMKDTDDPAEVLQRLAKRKDLITKGMIGAGAGALGYGAYKAFKHRQKNEK